MLEKQPERKDSPASAKGVDSLNLLDLQIAAHRKHDKRESWLSYGIGKITTLSGRSDESLRRLEELKEKAQNELKAGDREALARTGKGIARQVKADREALGWKDGVTHYGGGALKTAALFLRGGPAMAGTVALYGLDQANPHDSWKAQVADLTLGGMKGGALKLVLQKIGDKPLSAATKGIAMGLTNTAVEIGLTRKSYLDTTTGGFSPNAAVSNICSNMFDTRARLLDAGTFVAAHGLFGTVNALSAGALERSPLLSTMFTGGSFGLSSGAAGEFMRQKADGESFDLAKVVSAGLKQAVVDSVASIPGGLQARSMFKAHPAASHDRSPKALSAGEEQRLILIPLQESDGGRVETGKSSRSPAWKDRTALERTERLAAEETTGPDSKIEHNPSDRRPTKEDRTALDRHTRIAAEATTGPDSEIEQSPAARMPSNKERPAPERRAHIAAEGTAGTDAEIEHSPAAGKPAIDWDAPGALDIKPLEEGRLEDLVKRLGKHNVELMEHPVPAENAPISFKSWADFTENCLEWQLRPMRVIELEGTGVRVAVPEEHGPGLEAVRDLQLRAEKENDPALWLELSKHPLFNTVRPEHIAMFITELPDGGARLIDGTEFTRRINLYYGETSPYDAFHRQTYDENFRSAGQATTENNISLYRTNKGDSLEQARKVVFHEWAHTVKFSLPELSHLFNLAVALEESVPGKKAYTLRRYGLKNTEENWAVHTEAALRPDGGYLLELEAEAPIRLAIFGRALRKILDSVPERSRSVHHDRYLKRVQFIEEEVVPEAVERLWESVASENPRHSKYATELLGQLGGKDDLEVLAIRSSHPSLDNRTATRTFRAAMELGSRHPKEWLDALVVMSNGDSPVRHLAVKQLAETRAATGLPRFVRTQLEPDVRRQVNLRAAELLANRGDIDRARQLCLAELKSAENESFVSHRDYNFTVDTVNRIARAHSDKFDAPRGEALAERLIDLSDVDPAHPRTAATLRTIAELQAKQGRVEKAIGSYEFALGIVEQKLGKLHPQALEIRQDLADLTNRHAESLLREDRFEDALYMYSNELTLREQLPNHDVEYVQQLRDWLTEHSEPEPIAS